MRLSVLIGLLAAMTAFCNARAQTPNVDASSLQTSDRLEGPGWWPTKGDSERNLYAGSETCATCHRAIAEFQETTPMYHAGVRAVQSDILSTHTQLKFQEAGLNYSLTRSATGVTFKVDDGINSNAADAVWAFGAGAIGQTYVLKKGNAFIEGRLSYYARLAALDISIGHSPRPPPGIESALGHSMDTVASRRCFSCHTTEAVTSNIFEPDKAIPGIRCEACHGPGAAHVAAVRSEHYQQASASITNPAHLAPSDSVDFCGACHRTWADVVMGSPAGIGPSTVRFQPYLLENSRCWGKNGDPRITCIACHDPHKPLVRETSAYDSKCLACHSASLKTSTCKVASKNCVSCHMPKYELAQSHATFTDHFIRVVRTPRE